MSEEQLENQRKMKKAYKKSAKAHSNDRRFLIAAFVLSLLLKQSIDLVFASESTRIFIHEWAGKAANGVEWILDEMMHIAADCEASGSNGPICAVCTRFKHWNDVSDAKRQMHAEELVDEVGLDKSGTIHVVERANMTEILQASAEEDDFVATIVKTADRHDDTTTEVHEEKLSARDLAETPDAGLRRLYKHPLLERIIHSPMFIQFVLPIFTAALSAILIKYLPNNNNTVMLSFFLLVTYTTGRICLILY